MASVIITTDWCRTEWDRLPNKHQQHVVRCVKCNVQLTSEGARINHLGVAGLIPWLIGLPRTSLAGQAPAGVSRGGELTERYDPQIRIAHHRTHLRQIKFRCWMTAEAACRLNSVSLMARVAAIFYQWCPHFGRAAVHANSWTRQCVAREVSRRAVGHRRWNRVCGSSPGHFIVD